MSNTIKLQSPPLDFLTGPFTGHALQLMRNRHALLEKSMHQYGDFVLLKFFKQKSYLVLDPEGVKQVLHSKQVKYSKMARGTQMLALIGGRGLLTSEGAFWQQSRRVIQPFFSKKQFSRYLDLMNDCAVDLVNSWQVQAQNNAQINLAVDMTKFTLNILGRSLFNENFEPYTQTVYDELRTLLDITEKRILSLVGPRASVKKQWDQRFQKSLQNLEKVVNDLIEKSKNNPIKEPDKNFIHALLESDHSFSDQDLRDHIISLMIAGHETTATALSWMFITLERHPEKLQKLRQEVDQFEKGERLDLAAIEKLPYTHQVIQETLRLYPPFWVMGRVATEEDQLHGTSIQKGDRIQINPYLSHHNPRYWQAPQEFQPERFAPENLHLIKEYIYMPFGLGPRHCIGKDFGTYEMFIGLAHLYRSFSLEISDLDKIRPDFRITLRPDRDVMVKLKVR